MCYFFKQKTAYEMRISDWSSDLCSSDRLVIAGLNPHAGEDGALGMEEIDIIIPAVEQLRAEGIDITGPLPAASMFHEPVRGRYDVALCMYHDQALIPLKTLHFDEGVTMTLCLPIVRNRTEERSEGKECVSTVKSGWSRVS